MTVQLDDDRRIRLTGACLQDDAEALLRLLLENPEATVDWRGCEQAHAAIIQVLLVAGSEVLGPPTGAFLRNNVAPLFDAGGAGGSVSA